MADNGAKNPDEEGRQADARLDADFTGQEDLDEDEIAHIEQTLRRAAKEHRIDLGPLPKADVAHKDSVTQDVDPSDELDAQIREAEAKLRAALSDNGSDEPEEANFEIPHFSREDPLDEDLRRRVDRFGKKLDDIGARRESQRKTKKSQSELDRDAARGLGIGMMVAYLIIGVPLIGALVGYFIDRATNGANAMAIGVVVGAVLGVAMAISVMNRANRD